MTVGFTSDVLQPSFHQSDCRDVLFVRLAGRSVGGHGVADPGAVVADLGVDAGLVPLGTAVTPGDHALQLTVAHHGATGVSLSGHRWRGQTSAGTSAAFCQGEEEWRRYLAGVFASLQESSTDHVGGDLTRVGVPAVGVAQDGSVQAHQTVRVVACRQKHVCLFATLLKRSTGYICRL